MYQNNQKALNISFTNKIQNINSKIAQQVITAQSTIDHIADKK